LRLSWAPLRNFAAIEALETGKEVPRAWRPVFDAEARPGILILQYLLLGMNAHINFDLPIATERVARSADLKALEPDFLAINAILADLLDKVQAVIDRFSPLLDILDRIGGRTDEAIVTFSIDIARDEAWHEAARLDGETPDVRERAHSWPKRLNGRREIFCSSTHVRPPLNRPAS